MVDLGPLTPWKPSWMNDSSNWLYSPLHGFSHRWACTTGGDIMSGRAAPVTVSALINPITGETISCPPGTQIMCDDLDWMTEGWQAVFAIEWKIREAEHSASTEPLAPSS
jgi:hypothetical protein